MSLHCVRSISNQRARLTDAVIFRVASPFGREQTHQITAPIRNFPQNPLGFLVKHRIRRARSTK